MNSLNENSFLKSTNYKTKGIVQYQEFYPRKSKQLSDKLDSILSESYKLTEEELDFIINYDIKYRMGKNIS